MASHRLCNVFVLVLQIFEELGAHLAILGNLKLNRLLEGAVARWLDVQLDTKLFFFLAEAVPSLIHLQVVEAAFKRRAIRQLAFLVGTGDAFFVAHDIKGFFHLLELGEACAAASKRVVFLIVVALTLNFEFLGLNVLFDLVQVGQALRPEVLQLLNGLPQQPFFEDAVDQIGVLFCRVESGKDFHFVDDLPILFGLFALKFLDLFQV